MALYDLLVNFLGAHQILIIFFGSFFFGDTVIISLALLSAKGIISIPFILIFGFLGTITSDTIWFYTGKYFLNRPYLKKKTKKHDRLLSSINNLTGKKPFLFLLLAKFMYGTRIFFIIYLSARKIKFLTFLVFDMLGTAIWLITLTTIGWLAGKGASNLLPFLKEGEYILTMIIVLAIIIKFTTRWVTKKIEKE